MRKTVKIALIIAVILIAVVVIGPFLVPVKALDTVPAREVAYPDSQFITLPVRGLDVEVHVREIASRRENSGAPTFLLIHGFASSTYTWNKVMAPLAEYGRVVAFDWMPYGLTERPLPAEWRGDDSPYGRQAQVDLALSLMETLDIEKAVLVGNSAGGSLSAALAVQHPERVEALILVDAAVNVPSGDQDQDGGRSGLFGLLSSPLAQALGRTPQMRRVGPLLVRNIQDWGIDFGKSAWHDPDLLTDEDWDNYLLPLKVDNWDVGLYETVIAGDDLTGLAGSLSRLDLPILVVTGDDDRIVPTANSIRLAERLPGAGLAIFKSCGHAPQEECPDQFMASVTDFLTLLGYTASTG